MKSQVTARLKGNEKSTTQVCLKNRIVILNQKITLYTCMLNLYEHIPSFFTPNVLILFLHMFLGMPHLSLFYESLLFTKQNSYEVIRDGDM